MKKCYLLLCLMALTSLLLICNPVLADEQNSEDDRWKALEKAAAEGIAETAVVPGILIGVAAAAEIINQEFEDYDEVELKVADPKDQVDATEESLDQPALGLN